MKDNCSNCAARGDIDFCRIKANCEMKDTWIVTHLTEQTEKYESEIKRVSDSITKLLTEKEIN